MVILSSFKKQQLCSNFTNNSVTGSSGLGLHCKVYINSAQHSELYVNIAVKKCKFSSHNSTDITKPETGVLFANSVELAISSVNISDNTFGVFLVESKVTLGALFATLYRQHSIQLSSGRRGGGGGRGEASP